MVRTIRCSDEQGREGGCRDQDACKCTMTIIIGMYYNVDDDDDDSDHYLIGNFGSGFV